MTVSTKTLQIKGFFSPLEFTPGSLLLDTLSANNVSISQSCGGNGSCTTCRVFILAGEKNCGNRSELEVERAQERNFAPNERLACQTIIYDDIEIEILSLEEIS